MRQTRDRRRRTRRYKRTRRGGFWNFFKAPQSPPRPPRPPPPPPPHPPLSRAQSRAPKFNGAASRLEKIKADTLEIQSRLIWCKHSMDIFNQKYEQIKIKIKFLLDSFNATLYSLESSIDKKGGNGQNENAGVGTLLSETFELLKERQVGLPKVKTSSEDLSFIIDKFMRETDYTLTRLERKVGLSNKANPLPDDRPHQSPTIPEPDHIPSIVDYSIETLQSTLEKLKIRSNLETDCYEFMRQYEENLKFLMVPLQKYIDKANQRMDKIREANAKTAKFLSSREALDILRAAKKEGDYSRRRKSDIESLYDYEYEVSNPFVHKKSLIPNPNE